jgi:glycine dehydrogenase subunit 1
VTIFLTVYGKEGLRELAEQNLAKATYLRDALAKAGAKPLFSAPSFNEFVVALPASAQSVNTRLLAKEIVGGLALSKWYPELGEGAALWCATELTTKAQIDAAAQATGAR